MSHLARLPVQTKPTTALISAKSEAAARTLFRWLNGRPLIFLVPPSRFGS